MIFSPAVRIRKKTEARLEQYNQPSLSYFLLIILSSAIATAGLLLDNTSIVIGAMVVAPLITPIFGFALSFIVLKWRRMFISLGMLLSGTISAILISTVLAGLVTLVDGKSIMLTSEIISRTEPNLLYFLVALFSGMAGAYAYAKPDVLASLPGIAISVAVIPPLAVAGIGIVLTNFELVTQSLLLYGFNLAGILFGSLIIFLSFGFGSEHLTKK